MLLIYILLPFYLSSALAIFLVINTRWSKRNHIALNIFYSLTLLIPFPLELLIMQLIRSKYKKKTPMILKKIQEEGIKFHIVFGTLLFAYRNNNFADNDIDIAMYRSDFTDKTKASLVKLGFVLEEEGYLDGKLCEQTYTNKQHKISMDIFHMSKEAEFAPTFDEKNNRYARRPKDYKYSLKKININGLEVDAPSKPEEYLTGNYGVGKKKDPNYHGLHGSSTHPTIIVENANIEYKRY